METWSDIWLVRVNDWAQIASLLLLLFAVCAGYFVYATQKEITRRASTENQGLKDTLAKTSEELDSTKQELLRKTNDRSLTGDQKQSLKQSLKGVSGKVLVKADFADSEAKAFANQIKSVLAETDLEIIEQDYIGIVSLYAKGIGIIVNDMQNPPPHAVPIQKAFKLIGIEAPAGKAENAEFPQDALIVWICHK
ncbi:hypothetical protein ACFL1N_12380 [Thermodesulfobacteriota bacterium]